MKTCKPDLELLRDIVTRRAPHLTSFLSGSEFSREVADDLCDVLAVELAESGLDRSSEPTSRGVAVEDLIDYVRRMRGAG